MEEGGREMRQRGELSHVFLQWFTAAAAAAAAAFAAATEQQAPILHQNLRGSRPVLLVSSRRTVCNAATFSFSSPIRL